MRAALLTAALLFGASVSASAQCVNWSEARGVIARNNLASPGSVRKQAMSRGGEVISMNLCRQGDRYVYRLTIIGAGKQARDIVIDAGGGGGGAVEGVIGKYVNGNIGNYVKSRVRSYLRRRGHARGRRW